MLFIMYILNIRFILVSLKSDKINGYIKLSIIYSYRLHLIL